MIFLLSHSIDEAAHGDATHDAFRCPGEQLDYGGLAMRSNQLAHALQDQGAIRGDRIGIFMPPCIDSAVAVYGTLRVGAAFVPIDPLCSPGRLRQQISDCGIRYVIAHPTTVRTLEQAVETKAELKCILGPAVEVTETRNLTWQDVSGYPSARPPKVRILEQDLAYLMYTSGSTGRAKAIMHTHYSGLSYARLSAETYGVSSCDVIGNHSPLHFDMSTFGYLTGPFAGATTTLIPPAYAKLPASLSGLMEQEGTSIWYSVPFALIQMLLRGALEDRRLESLRWVLYGGEPFPPKHLYALMNRWPQARFSNVYGPAEVNQCTYYHVPAQTDRAVVDEPIPIGRVWPNTDCLILNDKDQPVEPQEPGELLIRSATMMRGYWGRDDLNSVAFYQDPKYTEYEVLYYRTGDIVRERADGNLIFLRRKDRQIKLRGYRVDLNDVERALAAHASVEEAAVYPVRNGDGEVCEIRCATILVENAQLDSIELKASAAETVPSYAVPHCIDFVDTLPRTATGKTDRRKLQFDAESSLAVMQNDN